MADYSSASESTLVYLASIRGVASTRRADASTSTAYCTSLLVVMYRAAARLIFNLRSCDHITDALISLHWLRLPERIIFKVATLTYRALHGFAPPYLASSFTCVADMPHRRRLRSASTEQLDVPTCRRSTTEVVPFLLLEQRCGMACQAMLRRPRRCRCSRTG